MQISSYIPIIVLFIIIYIGYRSRKVIVAKRIIEKKKVEDNTNMKELAKGFIGIECLIYSFDSSRQFVGIIKEVSDSAILVENKGQIEAINLDFVIRIREYPKNKKGKKKSVVLD